MFFREVNSEIFTVNIPGTVFNHAIAYYYPRAPVLCTILDTVNEPFLECNTDPIRQLITQQNMPSTTIIDTRIQLLLHTDYLPHIYSATELIAQPE